MRAISAGPKSNCPISFGSPALGWQLIQVEATSCSESICGRIATCPNARPIRRPLTELIARPLRASDCSSIYFAHQFVGQPEFLHAHPARAERIRFDDICPGRQIVPMDAGNLVWMRQTKNIGKIL